MGHRGSEQANVKGREVDRKLQIIVIEETSILHRSSGAVGCKEDDTKMKWKPADLSRLEVHKLEG